MKTFVMLLIALAASFAARADTVDLYNTAGAGNVHQYHNVPTSQCALCTLTIYISTHASATQPPPQSMQLWFGTDQTHSYFGPYFGSGVPTTLTGALGQITVQLNESVRYVYIGSGRGQHRAPIWTLLNGTLIR